MTCLNGYFHDAALESLAEALLLAEGGGALAVWASSGLTGPGGQALMNQELYRQLFTPSGSTGALLTLGEATVQAKAAVGNADLRSTWILFGDPTTMLNVQ
jgi:Peptidase family C25